MTPNNLIKTQRSKMGYRHQSPCPALGLQLAPRLAEGLIASVEPVEALIERNLAATDHNHPVLDHRDYQAFAFR
jgi:hypothetical protein